MPDNYELQKTTIWKFPERGKWATHDGKYRGNWSPHIPRNLILRYSNIGDTVLDCFLGSGTTMIESKLLKRKGIGVDINPNSIKIAYDKLTFDCSYETFEQQLYCGNAKDLSFIKDNSIDLICTHPPYANIIKYSDNIVDDISHFDSIKFIEQFNKISREFYRVLKTNQYCCIMIGDIRKNKNIIPLGFQLLEKFLNNGFHLKEIIIKEQFNCRSTDYWKNRSTNFLMIAHEYIYVLQKTASVAR